MKKERKNVKVADIMLNEGQVQWLPKNPRQWTREDLDRTKKSLEEDADFLEDRPILLIEHEGKYVTFAGNLRTSAAKELGMKNVPCVIYTAEDDADRETIKRRAMKDNGSFGAWDYDVLANEWDGLPLGDWGVPAWNTEVDDEDEGRFDTNNSTENQLCYAKICGYQIPMTDDEEKAMRERIEKYADENGILVGFFINLLDNEE